MYGYVENTSVYIDLMSNGNIADKPFVAVSC